MPTPAPRPRQVNTAVVAVIAGAVATVLFAFQRISSLGSTEFQDSARQALADQPGSLSLTVADVQTLVRVVTYVAAVLAVVAVGLALEARQRRRRGRLLLTVLTPVLTVLGLVVSPVAVGLIIVGTVLLWLEEPRAWFDGRVPAGQPGQGSQGSQVGAVRPPTTTAPVPAPRQPVGTAVRPPYDAPVAPPATRYDQPWGQPAPRPVAAAPVGPEVPWPRPRQVVMACVLTWVSAAVVGGFAALTLLVVLADPQGLVDQLGSTLSSAGLSTHQFLVLTRITTVVLVVWSGLAAGLALGVFLRRRWAAVALLVSSVLAALACLVSVVSVVVSVLPLAACVVVVVQLTRPASRAWLAQR